MNSNGASSVSVSDLNTVSERWCDHLAVTIAGACVGFFKELHTACINHRDTQLTQRQDLQKEDYDLHHHFRQALIHLDLDKFTDSVNAIVGKLPNLSAAFKIYFATSMLVVTSVRPRSVLEEVKLMKGTMPTKMQIVKMVMEEARLPFLDDADLINRDSHAIACRIRQSVRDALGRLVMESAMIVQFLNEVKAGTHFGGETPAVEQPQPQPQPDISGRIDVYSQKEDGEIEKSSKSFTMTPDGSLEVEEEEEEEDEEEEESQIRSLLDDTRSLIDSIGELQ